MHRDLIDKINNAKTNDADMHILIDEYMPFIKSEIHKSKSSEKFEEDDLLSIAMLAFNESVKKYEEEKGNFISFSSRLIRLRLIDYYRSQAKFDSEVLDKKMSDDIGNSRVELGLNKKSLEEYSTSQINILRREEILEFKEELALFEIDFSKIQKSSPKKKELRRICFEIANYILDDSELYNRLLTKKTLDLERLCKTFKIHRKKIERARVYIIAIIIVLRSDYIFIKDYVNWR